MYGVHYMYINSHNVVCIYMYTYIYKCVCTHVHARIYDIKKGDVLYEYWCVEDLKYIIYIYAIVYITCISVYSNYTQS